MVAHVDSPPMESQRPLLNASELAGLLNLSLRQVYEWTVRRVIPDSVVLRVGRRVYYRRIALLIWLRGEAFPLDRATGDPTARSREMR